MDKIEQREKDPEAYRQEYRATLRRVLLDLLKENHPAVNALLKSAIKEWLDEQLGSKSTIAVKLVGALVIGAVAYVLFWPKK